MYIRTKILRGRRVQYLVKSYRDPQTGQPRQKAIAYLGYGAFNGSPRNVTKKHVEMVQHRLMMARAELREAKGEPLNPTAGLSLHELARMLNVDVSVLSRASADAARTFGLRNAYSTHDWRRKTKAPAERKALPENVKHVLQNPRQALPAELATQVATEKQARALQAVPQEKRAETVIDAPQPERTEIPSQWRAERIRVLQSRVAMLTARRDKLSAILRHWKTL